MSANNRSRMFLRMMMRSLTVRRGRSLTALMALTVAAAAATTLLNLYADLDAKLNKEFRNFGANIIVTTQDGSALPPDAISQVRANLHPADSAVPYAYAIATTESGQKIVVAGTDLAAACKMNPAWHISSADASPDVLIGKRAIATLPALASGITLSFHGKQHSISTPATLSTGGPEDSRI